MRSYKPTLLFGLLLLQCVLIPVCHGAPQTGWYWNPNESGRGFFVESHDGITFVGAYLYDSDGHALWLVAGGANADSYNYSGPLYSQSGGQTLFGNYVAPAAPVSVGNITVHFSDDTHGTVTWPGGAVAIERDIFGTGDAAFQPDNGWWWNSNESGSGYSLEVQGKNLFVVGFMYETSGRPVWYFSAGPMTSATTYHGDVLQFAGGQTIGGPYHPPGIPTKVGTLDIEFTAENEASTTLTDSSGATKRAYAKAGPRSNQWTPQFSKPGRFVFPTSYSANFDLESDFAGISSGELTITANAVPMIESFTAVGAYRQYMQDPQARVTVVYAVVGQAGDCRTSGTLNVALPPDSVELRVTSFSKYTVTLKAASQIIPATLTCPGPPATTLSVAYPWPGVTYTHTGAINNLDLEGNYDKGSITDTWIELYLAGGHADLNIFFVPSHP